MTARQNRIERCTSRVLPLSIGVFRLKIALLVSEELCLQAKPRSCPEKEKERIIIHKIKQSPELNLVKFRLTREDLSHMKIKCAGLWLIISWSGRVNLNGHVGANVEGIKGFHGWFRFGKKNVEGEMILEFANTLNFAILLFANTWFKKNKGRFITYENKVCRTVVDYILVRKSERTLIRDVEVI